MGDERKGFSRRAPEWLLGDRWSFGWAGGVRRAESVSEGDLQARRSTKPLAPSPPAVPSASSRGGRRVIDAGSQAGGGKTDMRLVSEVRFSLGKFELASFAGGGCLGTGRTRARRRFGHGMNFYPVT